MKVLWLLGWLGAAHQPKVVAAPPPVVLFLKVGRNPRETARETRLFEELGLALDSFAVLSVQPEDPQFPNKPLATQLSAVQSLTEREDAVAVTWLASPLPGRLMLHLIAAHTGRILIRSIPATDDPRSEAKLALAVRELLGTAYLFEPTLGQAPAVNDVVASLREELAPPPMAAVPVARPPAPPSAARWGALGVEGLFTQGLIGQQGAAHQFGGAVRLEERVGPGFHAAVSLEAEGGPLYSDGQTRIDGWEIAPGLGAFYGWDVGPLTWGPSVEIEGGFQRLLVSGSAPTQAFSSLKLRALAGLALRVGLGDGVALTLTPQLGYSALQTQILSRTDGALFLASPWIEGRISLGLLFGPGA